MDFQSAMETFAEAWMAANTKIRPDISEIQQREGSSDRANGRPVQMDDEINQPTSRVTNGNSPPTGHSPLSLVRDSLTSPRLANNNNNTAVTDGKSQIPIHVVIERVPICHSEIVGDLDLQSRVEFDRITLVPAHLRFSDLFQVVLAKTGFLDDLPYARAFLQLRNWRPLPVEQIPETETKTVAEVLADIAPLVTLYVRLYSSTRVRRTRDTKDRLLGFLVTRPQCQHLLISAGCPLDENSLFSLLRGNGDISEDTARQIEAWWAVQVAHASRPPPTAAQMLTPGHGLHHPPPSTHGMDKIPMEPIHPALQQTLSSHYGTHKTRMRTSFDPEYELPRLHRWFSDNPHPTRIQVQRYLTELNALESRRGRKPLESNSIIYWFKNQRAASKRHEFRSLNGMKSPLLDEVSVSDNEDNSDSYQPAGQVPNSSRSPSPSQPPPPSSLLVSSSNLVVESSAKSVHQPHGEGETDIIKDEVDLKDVSRVTSSPTTRNHLLSSGTGNNLLETSSNAGGDRDQIMDSDIDLSEDEEDCRSRESVPTLDIKPWGSPSPVVSPGSLSLPTYPSIPGLVQPGAVDRLPYSVMSGPLFQHSMMYMAQYMPQVPPFPGGLSTSGMPEERRKRNRTFIDPVTEVPRLEQWFALNTHPSHNIILKYTDELNRMPYRQKFPKLEPKNIQFWFKNRRAKCKRLRVSM